MPMMNAALQAQGNDMEIGFNCKYLLEALKAVPSENISLELKTNLSPAVSTPAREINLPIWCCRYG